MHKLLLAFLSIVFIAGCTKEDDSSHEHEHQHEHEIEVPSENKSWGKEYEKTMEQMEDMSTHLSKNDLPSAIKSFDEAHPFFHTADPLLRLTSPESAQKLWDAMLAIETELQETSPSTEKLLPLTEETSKLLIEVEGAIK